MPRWTCKEVIYQYFTKSSVILEKICYFFLNFSYQLFFFSTILPIKLRPTSDQDRRSGTSADVPNVPSPTSMEMNSSSNRCPETSHKNMTHSYQSAMSFGSKKRNYDYIGANLDLKIVYTSMTLFFICSLCVSTSINLSACLSVSLSDFNRLKILSRTSVVFRFFYKYAFF